MNTQRIRKRLRELENTISTGVIREHNSVLRAQPKGRKRGHIRTGERGRGFSLDIRTNHTLQGENQSGPQILKLTVATQKCKASGR
jgi:hypothetical protein